ncbi:hypothetical protein [Roseibium sp.]|uniref:hypothetical protein n=1 Tax=Roseibium sp. TaxID=1936156 RepID=UPI003BAE8047
MAHPEFVFQTIDFGQEARNILAGVCNEILIRMRGTWYFKIRATCVILSGPDEVTAAGMVTSF